TLSRLPWSESPADAFRARLRLQRDCRDHAGVHHEPNHQWVGPAYSDDGCWIGARWTALTDRFHRLPYLSVRSHRRGRLYVTGLNQRTFKQLVEEGRLRLSGR